MSDDEKQMFCEKKPALGERKEGVVGGWVGGLVDLVAIVSTQRSATR